MPRKPTPKPPPPPAQVLISLRVTEAMRDRIHALAARWGASREGTIRQLLAEALSQDGEHGPIPAGIKGQRAAPQRFTLQTTEKRRRRGPSRPGARWRRKDRAGFEPVKPAKPDKRSRKRASR